jgi:hypothetical protein
MYKGDNVDKVQKKDSCPDGVPHFWDIDANNQGKCRRCGQERDFGVLLRREFKSFRNTRPKRG